MSLLPSHWYYNTESGELTHGNNLENLGNNLVGGAGWHELNIPGNATEAQAAAEAKREFPAGAAPTTSVAQGEKQAVQQETGTSLAGLSAIGDFFSRLTESNTWLRAGEIALGLLLIAVGVSKMTSAVPAATKIAKAVA